MRNIEQCNVYSTSISLKISQFQLLFSSRANERSKGKLYSRVYIYIILLLVVVKVMFAKLGDKDGKKYIISTTRCGENRFSAKWNRKNKNMESRDSPKGLNRVSRFTFNFTNQSSNLDDEISELKISNNFN